MGEAAAGPRMGRAARQPPMPAGAVDIAWNGSSLHYCGQALTELVEVTGTPAFLYSENRLQANVERLRQGLALPQPWRLRLAYSVKTAPEPELLAILAAAETDAEVACAHELNHALSAGYGSEAVLVDGPSHTESFVRHALGRGANWFKIDSLDQLRTVTDAAGPKSDLGVCLRLTPPRRSRYLSPLSWLEGRFGMGPTEMEAALDHLAYHRGRVRFRGFAMHLGSQLTSASPYERALHQLAAAYGRARAHGLNGREVNIGGGFPSPSLTAGLVRSVRGISSRAEPDPTRRCDAMLAAVGRAVAAAPFPSSVVELVAEPGRALVGNAAVLITRVVSTKRRWLFLDASRNFVPESLLFARRGFVPARVPASARWRRHHLCGCTLHGADVLALAARLPPCGPNDLLVMLDAGAYTIARASQFTTARPVAYILRANGSLQPLRRPVKVVP